VRTTTAESGRGRLWSGGEARPAMVSSSGAALGVAQGDGDQAAGGGLVGGASSSRLLSLRSHHITRKTRPATNAAFTMNQKNGSMKGKKTFQKKTPARAIAASWRMGLDTVEGSGVRGRNLYATLRRPVSTAVSCVRVGFKSVGRTRVW
jgi:hypothetical protein